MSIDYGQQIADLTEDAFQNLDEGIRTSPANPGDLLMVRAGLQIQAAQTLAALALAGELRAVGLILSAANHPAAEPSASVAREAFTAAAIHLGLVEEDVQTTGKDEEWLYGPDQDPADKDVEL